MSEEVMDVRLKLKGEIVQQFREIKRHLGLHNDTEVIRFVIADYYKRKMKRVKKVE